MLESLLSSWSPSSSSPSKKKKSKKSRRKKKTKSPNERREEAEEEEEKGEESTDEEDEGCFIGTEVEERMERGETEDKLNSEVLQQEGSKQKYFSSSSVPLSEVSSHDFGVLCFTAFQSALEEIRDDAGDVLSHQQRGFPNLGNSCFANCILQAISNTTIMQRFISRLHSTCAVSQLPAELSTWRKFICLLYHSMALEKTLNGSECCGQMLEFLTSVVHEFRSSQLDSLRNNTPAAFTTSLTCQSDSMEFLTFLLDTLHEEMRVICCHEGINQASQSNDDDDDDGWEEVGKGKTKITIDANQSKKLASEVIRSSIISQTFHGSFRSTVVYEKKKNTSITYQRFHFIPLDIENYTLDSDSVSLYDSFLAHFKEEVLCGDASNRILKNVTIEQAPRVLILQLKRFRYDKRENKTMKISANVSFRDRLMIPQACLSIDLQSKLQCRESQDTDSTCSHVPPKSEEVSILKSRKSRRRKNAQKNAAEDKVKEQNKLIPGWSNDNNKKSNKKKSPVLPHTSRCGLNYILQAVVLHHGNTAQSGHYTSLIRNDNDRQGTQWLLVDDDKISKVSESFVFERSKSEAYILFYELV